ncbi:UDP-glucosyl transferase 73B2-like [Primulina huaijiensis]|uniref:UDP-glucosyl transferase 73B2-like n=1 Tax=Primulina huaijiensis TaxID=1492673 RepID=UPI003CC71925
MGATDILVLPFFGQGHLNPSVELCKRLASCSESKVILIIPSLLSSSVPKTLHKNNRSIEVLQIDVSHSQPPPLHPPGSDGARFANGRDDPDPEHGNRMMGQGIEGFLAERYKRVTGQTRPSCVVMDLMMSWSKEIFLRENIPIVSFFSCGAASTAMEYAAWKAQAHDMRPGQTRVLTGLPDSVVLEYSDTKRRSLGGPPPGELKHGEHGPDFGIRDPGQAPRWLEDGVDSAALLLNTCHELEGTFLNYISNQVNKPVFGVGPLLPDTYWKSIGTVFHDRDSRSNRKSNYTEDEVTQWLDSKPSKSVIYIAFGSEVGPDIEEYGQLADALGDSKWSFIWVIQPGSGKPKLPPSVFGEKHDSNEKDEGFYPEGLDEKVGNRGIVIKGWAPQLLILSHPSTGGFLSHCGWNSTVEAIGRGVPILAWPIRGDQYYNAKLVVAYLKTGIMVATGDNLTKMVKKSDIIQGIDSVMDDKEIHKRAVKIGGTFESGFPSSSTDSIKELIEFVSNI